MNQTYKSIYNEQTGAWVAVSELTRTGGKKAKSTHALGLAVAVAATLSGMGGVWAADAVCVDPATGLPNGTASGTGSEVACGQGAVASGTNAVAIGLNAQANALNSIAIGNNAGVNTRFNNAIAIGNGAQVLNYASTGSITPSVAIGSNATARDSSETIIGSFAGNGATLDTSAASGGPAFASDSAMFGSHAGYNSIYKFATFIGQEAGRNSSGVHNTAIGQNAMRYTTGSYNTALGSNAMVGTSPTSQATGQSNTGIGISALANFNGSFNSALGYAAGNRVKGDNNSAVGYSSGAGVTGNYNVAHGSSAGSNTTGNNNIATGYLAGLLTKGDNNIAIGNTAGLGISATDTIAIGSNALANKDRAIAIGKGAQATGIDSISIGTGNRVNGNNSGAIGDPSIINGSNSYSVGNNNAIPTNDTFVLGNSVTSSVANSVYLGSSSTATSAVTAASAGTTAVTNATVGSTTYAFAGGTATPVGAVSVGAVGAERRIQNVAAGLITNTSTDAINGSQLYAVAAQATAGATHYYSVNDTGAIRPAGSGTNYDNLGATGIRSMALGESATASTNNSIAMGYAATLGTGGPVASNNAVTIGNQSVAYNNSVSLGYRAGYQSTSPGGPAHVNGGENVFIGAEAGAQSAMNDSVIVGAQAGQRSSGEHNTAMGEDAMRDTTGNNNSGFGTGAGQGTTAVKALGNQNTAIGYYAGTGFSGNNNTASGTFSGRNVTGDRNIAMGYLAGNNITASDTVAIGTNSKASITNNVALGANSIDKAAVQVNSATVAGRTATLNADGTVTYTTGPTITYSGFAGTATGVVSVGALGAERQIVNVAAGEISATSTDAINGSQLYAVAAAINGSVTNIVNNAQTHYYSVNDGGTQQANYANDGATGANSVASGVGASSAGASSVAMGHGANVAAAATGGVAIGKDASTTVAGGVAIGEGSVSSTASGVAGYVPPTADAAQTAAIAATTSTAGAVAVGDASNGVYRQITGVAAGSVDSDAVNVAQLKATVTTAVDSVALNFTGNTGGTVTRTNGQTLAIQGEATTAGTYTGANIKTVTDPNTGAINIQMAENPVFTSVTTGNTTLNNDGLVINNGPSVTSAGINANNTVISNVAAGVANTDAVNVSQLRGVGIDILNQANSYTDNRINNLDDKLSGRIAAAMALEAAPYIPHKLTYYAGFGYSGGQTAFGVSLRKTSDNGRWSISGGVSGSVKGGVNARIGVTGIID